MLGRGCFAGKSSLTARNLIQGPSRAEVAGGDSLMHIPFLILVACLGLFLFFALMMVQMFLEASKALGAVRALAKALASVSPASRLERRHGLRSDQLDPVRHRCGQLPEPIRGWWYRIEESLEKYTSPEGREGWFLTAPPREVLREETVCERLYNSSFYQAVPGILTGLGLLSTFVAILLALTGLHVTVANNTETVTGIKELIEGLSGKFLSSIVGLLLSMIFLLAERKLCARRLSESYEDLLEAATRLIPTIAPTRIQLDTQTLAARQLALLANLEAEVANLRGMVSVANAAVPEMAGVLAGDVEHLSDKLLELSGLLDRGIRQLR
jgi:hypothetical protein